MAKKYVEEIVTINDIVFPNKGVGLFNENKVYINIVL